MSPKYLPVYFNDGVLRAIDQAQLPGKIEYFECRTQYEVMSAIRENRITGRESISLATCYGMAIAVHRHDNTSFMSLEAEAIASANLMCTECSEYNIQSLAHAVLSAARSIENKDRNSFRDSIVQATNVRADFFRHANEAVGRTGLELIKVGSRVLLYASGLSVCGPNAAMATLYSAASAKRYGRVFVPTSSPGAIGRLVAWELKQARMCVTMIPDTAMAWHIDNRRIDVVIMSAERVAKNGDVMGRIGCNGIAAACQASGVPCYFAAPTHVINLDVKSGSDFKLNERFVQVVYPNLHDLYAYEPLVDITPAKRYTGLITDNGIVNPDADEIERVFAF